MQSSTTTRHSDSHKSFSIHKEFSMPVFLYKFLFLKRQVGSTESAPAAWSGDYSSRGSPRRGRTSSCTSREDIHGAGMLFFISTYFSLLQLFIKECILDTLIYLQLERHCITC